MVALQQRRIDFSDVEAPEIEIKSSRVLKECTDSLELMRFLEELPGHRPSDFLWWALDRMEQCTHCGRGFNTGKMHWALAVTIQERGEKAGRLIACWYPQRFCSSCQPPAQYAGRFH